MNKASQELAVEAHGQGLVSSFEVIRWLATHQITDPFEIREIVAEYWRLVSVTAMEAQSDPHLQS